MSNVAQLIYVPILHTPQETGEIAATLAENSSNPAEPSLPSETEKSIKEMWGGIAKKIQETKIPFAALKIYQDALPVCGREKEIVSLLAQKGSRNHQLILELMKKGAQLEGTEDPELLLKEYDYIKLLLDGNNKPKDQADLKNYRQQSGHLLKQRDCFIAEQIKKTIKDDKIPLVFMGVRHQLEPLLEPHFVINYLIYRLPFKKVQEIYNL